MMRSTGPVVVLLWACAVLSANAEDSKWVWGGDSAPARLVNDNNRAERLRDRELVEEFPVRRPLFRPAQDYQPGDRPNFRPTNRQSEVDSLNRFGPQTFAKPPRRVAENDRRPSTRGPGGSLNDFDRPFGPGNGPDRYGGPNFGPNGPANFGGPGGPGLGGPGLGGPGLGGPAGQGQGGPAILTGPVPSWEQGRLDGPFQGFDRCKCAHAFNCISPGIQFGHCGEGKVYCCHNSIHEGGGGANLDRDALQGPTGPGIGPGGIGPGGIGPGGIGPGAGIGPGGIGPGAGIGPGGIGPGGIGPGGIGPGGIGPGLRPGNFDRPYPNGERPLLGGNGLGGERPILVGPGGPTGIVSEGLGGRPFAVGGPGGVRPGGIGPGLGGNRPFLPDGSGIGAGERPLYGQGGHRPGQFGGVNGFYGGSNGFNGGSNGFNGGSNGFNGGSNGFNGGSNGFNGGSNGFNGRPSGFNGGGNGFNGGSNGFSGFNGGVNGLNGGPNGFNGGQNNFNGRPSGFNGGQNNFNGRPSGFNGGPNGFNGDRNGFTGGPIRGNGGRPPLFNSGRPLGFNGGAGVNRPFVDYDDDFIGRNTNGKYSVSRYEPLTINSRSNDIKRDAEADKEAVVVEAAKPEEVAKN